MASGNTLCVLVPQSNEPPSSNNATFDLRNLNPVLDFDPSTIESAIFSGGLPSTYAGGGITVDLFWMATSATSGDCKWGVSYEEQDPNNNDLDSDNWGTESTVISTTNGTSGKITKSTLTISQANMGSPVAGDPFRLRVRRIANDAGDTMAGDAELRQAQIKET